MHVNFFANDVYDPVLGYTVFSVQRCLLAEILRKTRIRNFNQQNNIIVRWSHSF